MPVHRIGLTELSGSHDARDGPFRVNIIFVHGFRGHPQHTWEDSRDRGSVERGEKNAEAATPRKRNIWWTLKVQSIVLGLGFEHDFNCRQ
ncbi:hypothetical protein VTG60DRAFT_385 [Thermothelomyces hinnuleus]